MIIEVNGKSLSDSCDVFIYYSKLTNNKKLFSDIISLRKLASVIKMWKENESAVDNVDELEEMFYIFRDLYFAGRCAFEDRLIPMSELKEEISIKSLFDFDFYTKMFEYIGGVMPTTNKKKTQTAKRN